MAGLPHEVAVTNAFLSLEQLDVVAMTEEERLKALKHVAEDFVAVASKEPRENRRVQYFSISGKCFLGVPDVPKAASSFVQAKEYTRAVTLYRSIPMFDDALNIVRSHRDRLPEGLAEKVTYAAQLHYFLQKFVDALSAE